MCLPLFFFWCFHKWGKLQNEIKLHSYKKVMRQKLCHVYLSTWLQIGDVFVLYIDFRKTLYYAVYSESVLAHLVKSMFYLFKSLRKSRAVRIEQICQQTKYLKTLQPQSLSLLHPYLFTTSLWLISNPGPLRPIYNCQRH